MIYYEAPDVTVINSDVRAGLRSLPAGSVQTICTSPPYWGLRSYSGDQAVMWGGDPECAHEWGSPAVTPGISGGPASSSKTLVGTPSEVFQRRPDALSYPCVHCGAWQGALGLEVQPDCLAWARGEPPCPRCYVCHMREIAAELWRVLRDDGTLWLNCGDTYSTHTGKRSGQFGGDMGDPRNAIFAETRPLALPEKNLTLVPSRLALALQADGWIVRSAIAWCKTSAMPESVEDRPSSAWEHVWLLAKRPTYFYDATAVRSSSDSRPDNWQWIGESKPFNVGEDLSGGAAKTANPQTSAGLHRQNGGVYHPDGANLRNWWALGPSPYPDAHFAVFVPEIPRRAILAGTSERGACAACGSPWRRVTEQVGTKRHRWSRVNSLAAEVGGTHRERTETRVMETTGWQPTCDHNAAVASCRVLDPFAGSGTTGLVARQLGRHATLIDVSSDYCAMAVKRITAQTPSLFSLPLAAGRGAGGGEGWGG